MLNDLMKARDYLCLMASVSRSTTAVIDEISIGNAEGEKFVRIGSCNYDYL